MFSVLSRAWDKEKILSLFEIVCQSMKFGPDFMIDYKQATVFSWFSGALDRGHISSFAPCVLYIRETFYQRLTIS